MESRIQRLQPTCSLPDLHGAIALLVAQVANQLHGLGISPLRGKSPQGGVRFGVAQLAFNEMGQRSASGGLAAQAKVHLCTVFGANVMQIHFFAFGILLPMHLFEQMAGHQVFEPGTLVTLHRPVSKK